MLIKPERLADHLAREPLKRCYLLFGDEPCQALDSAHAIRAAANRAGITERLVFDATTGIDWQALRQEAGSLSLFASRRLLEVRLGGRKPDKAAGEALAALLGGDESEDVWLVTAPQLDKRDQGSVWFTSADRRGVVVSCRALDAEAFRRWLAARAHGAGLRLAGEALELLAVRAEGNLLAAAQEIDKLSLVCGDGQVAAEQVLLAVADSARYDVFKLIDATLEGNAARAVRILRGLREEGTEAVVVSWALNRELRTLARAAAAVGGGGSVESALAAQGVWQTRIGLLRRALTRLRLDRLLELSRASARTDAVVKGAADGDPWGELETLIVVLSRSGANLHDRGATQ